MVPDYKEQLGKAIAQRRVELGLTQRELAEQAHVREATTVSRWERGERAPNDLEAVARALDCSAVELLAGLAPEAAQDGRGVPPGEDTQLDRIEQKLDELLGAVLGPSELSERELERLAERARKQKQARSAYQRRTERT